MSTYEIARELERRGIKSRKASTFQHSNIRNWLQNPIYMGAGTTHKVEDIKYPIEAPALVDEDTWREAQKVIGRTANPESAARSTPTPCLAACSTNTATAPAYFCTG